MEAYHAHMARRAQHLRCSLRNMNNVREANVEARDKKYNKGNEAEGWVAG